MVIINLKRFGRQGKNGGIKRDWTRRNLHQYAERTKRKGKGYNVWWRKNEILDGGSQIGIRKKKRVYLTIGSGKF